MRVGLVSDTHGLLRPEALDFLRGSDHIIHGGDIGDAAILDTLGAIAPLSVVRGNNDTAAWARALPHSVLLRLGGVAVYVVHDIKELDIDPVAEGVRVVVSGHSHKPSTVERDGVLYVNPGSAGRRRFSLPIAVGELQIEDMQARASVRVLEVR